MVIGHFTSDSDEIRLQESMAAAKLAASDHEHICGPWKKQPDCVVLYDEDTDIDFHEPILRAGQDFCGVLVDFEDIVVKEDYYIDPVDTKVYYRGDEDVSPDIWDIVVFETFDPSRDLTFLMKAMYSGAVIITTPHRELKNIVAHGVNGIIGSTPVELDLYVEELKKDPLTMMELSMAGHNWMARTADIRLLTARIEEYECL